MTKYSVHRTNATLTIIYKGFIFHQEMYDTHVSLSIVFQYYIDIPQLMCSSCQWKGKLYDVHMVSNKGQ